MKIKVLLVSVGVVCCPGISRPASAQDLSLTRDAGGTVTLHATNVTVDEILARWSKTTGLTIVSQNGHGSDVPVTVHVSGVTEREALGLVLRDLSGYIMGERRDPQTGAVSIDRLVILPDSAARASEAPAVARRWPVPAAAPPPPAEVIQPVDEEPTELAPIVDAPVESTEP